MKKIGRSAACFAAATLVVCTAGAIAKSDATKAGQTADARPDAPAASQPDFGQLMTAYGNRFVDAYFAAEGGNWGLARYEIEKLHQIEDAGAVSQPKYAANLKAFDSDYLRPLKKAVLAQEWSNFKTVYRKAAGGCNECHTATGRGFIRFKIPYEPVEKHIDFLLKSEPDGTLQPH